LKREAELATKREELRATLAVRRVIQKLRVSKIDGFEELEQELSDVVKAELDNCGSQRVRMKEESEKALEQARLRVGQMKQEQKLLEERRAEEEKKRKEIHEKAESLLTELDGLVAEAEETSNKLKEVAAPLLEQNEVQLDNIDTLAKAVQEASAEAKRKMQVCTTFILTKGPEIKVHTPHINGDQTASEQKQTLAKLLQRINETTRSNDAVIARSKDAKEKAIRKAGARKKQQEFQSLFEKYDKDKDQLLSNKEIVQYAKGEFGFTVLRMSL